MSLRSNRLRLWMKANSKEAPRSPQTIEIESALQVHMPAKQYGKKTYLRLRPKPTGHVHLLLCCISPEALSIFEEVCTEIRACSQQVHRSHGMAKYSFLFMDRLVGLVIAAIRLSACRV